MKPFCVDRRQHRDIIRNFASVLRLIQHKPHALKGFLHNFLPGFSLLPGHGVKRIFEKWVKYPVIPLLIRHILVQHPVRGHEKAHYRLRNPAELPQLIRRPRLKWIDGVRLLALMARCDQLIRPVLQLYHDAVVSHMAVVEYTSVIDSGRQSGIKVRQGLRQMVRQVLHRVFALQKCLSEDSSDGFPLYFRKSFCLKLRLQFRLQHVQNRGHNRVGAPVGQRTASHAV